MTSDQFGQPMFATAVIGLAVGARRAKDGDRAQGHRIVHIPLQCSLLCILRPGVGPHFFACAKFTKRVLYVLLFVLHTAESGQNRQPFTNVECWNDDALFCWISHWRLCAFAINEGRPDFVDCQRFHRHASMRSKHVPSSLRQLHISHAHSIQLACWLLKQLSIK